LPANRHHVFTPVLLSLLFILFLIVSCTYSNREEGYVYFRLNTNPTTLDPAYIVDVTGGSLSAKIFNGLVKISEDLKIIPDIAYKWNVSPNGLVYTFYLRQDVRFSNGRGVKASDFIYSFTRMLDPKNNCPNIWVLDKIRGVTEFRKEKAENISGLKVIDEYTLQIILERSFSPFMSLLTMTSAYVVPEEEVSRYGDKFGFNPVGTGPYKLKEWKPNDELIFEARNDYFEGMPPVKGLVYRIIPEDLTTITEFELGNLDVIALPASAYGHFTKDSMWKDQIISQKGLNTYYLGFNCQKPPFNNEIVRRAVGFAIDREKILNTFFEKRGRLARGPVPDNLRKWRTDIPYSFDSRKAIALLKKANLHLPVEIDFYITAKPQDIIDMAEIIQSYMGRAGFSVRIQQLEWSAYKEALSKGKADMFWISWWADYPDPENFLFPLFHSSNAGPAGNRTRYRNAAVDDLIEKGQSSTDIELRNDLYRKAEQLIIDEAPWIPFWHRNDYILKQKWIEKMRAYPIYSIDKGMDIVLSEPAGPKN
jgi:peptide/nickel transport system substrate-binding protein/oligopeptide transport system substrate-binding protein